MFKTLSTILLVSTAAISVNVLAADSPPKYGDISHDGRWIYVGGDSGWDPAPHRYVRRNGQWVHEDGLVHDSPRPAWLTMADRERQIPVPGGRPHSLERRNGNWVHVDTLHHGGPMPGLRTIEERPWGYVSGD